MAIPWKPEWQRVVSNIELQNVGRGHRYVVPGEVATLASVTTRTNVIAKGFGFNQWLRRDSLEYMVNMLLTSEPLPNENYVQYLNRLSKMSENPPSDKRDLGTLTHAILEEYFTGTMPPLPFELDEDFEKEGVESAKVALEHIEILGIDGSTVESEVKIYSPAHAYAGTIDLVGYSHRFNAWLCLDWKRAKGLWPENSYQIGAYASALEEVVEDGTPVQGWVCLMPSEPGIMVDRKEANLEWSLETYLLAQALHERHSQADKYAWK